jgi:hypothetical protein
MISRFGPFTSFQVNVDANGNNIVGDAANEPSIAVDPTDGSKMAIGWRQFDDVTSNFREAGYGYTTDGGTTWTFPGVLQNNVFRSDPVLNSDEAGGFFYLSLESTTGPPFGFFCDDVWGSLNGGQSWTLLPPGEARMEGTRNGLPLIKPTAWGAASSTSFGAKELNPHPATAVHSTGPSTAGSLGRLRSVFLTLPNGEHSTWLATATCLSVAGIFWTFGAFARLTHRTAASRQLLTK